MDKILNNKVAIVTGAAQGIGLSIAKKFAQEGATVIMCDINEHEVKNQATILRNEAMNTLGMGIDVTKSDAVKDLITHTIDHYSKIDILVNCAGILRSTRFHDISFEEWNLVLDVNLNGTFLITKAVVDHMISSKYGRIINMSSSAGRSVSTLGGAHYTASKAAVLGLTRAVAKELGRFSITVNAICPGLIDTKMARVFSTPEEIEKYENSFPIPRLGTSTEVADLALFLASDAASYITGASIDINGGDLML